MFLPTNNGKKESRPRDYKCKFCLKNFDTRRKKEVMRRNQLNHEKKTCFSNPKNYRNNPWMLYNCPDCCSSFKLESEFLGHKDVNDFVIRNCQKCNQIFVNACHLLKHLRTVNC